MSSRSVKKIGKAVARVNNYFSVDKARILAIWSDMDGKTVARVRKRLKLTQAEFARRVGVDRSAVLRWERGSRNVSALAERVIQQIAADANKEAAQ